MMNASDFVDMFHKPVDEPLIKFAKVADTEGRILFDGETTVTQKKYPRLESYSPTVGDRVMILRGVIMGKLTGG